MMYCLYDSRVTGGGCSMQHANALLLLCCIAQRPDIEAETRVVVRRQDADELILCYIHVCASRISTSVAASSSSSRGYRYVYVHVVTQIHVVRRGCCGVVVSRHPRVDNMFLSQPASQLISQHNDTRHDKERHGRRGIEASRIPWRVQQCRETSARWT